MSRIPLLLLFSLTLPVLLLPGCGDDAGKDPAGTPYGTSPPYASTPYGAGGGEKGTGISAELRKEVDAALVRGRENLLAVQSENGGFGDPALGMDEPSVGFTAMAVGALIASTPSTKVKGDAHVTKALDYLVSQQKDDGSIYDNPQYRNYMTSSAVGAFAIAKIAAYRQNELRARDFLAASQIAGDEGDLSYGGFPYKQDQGQAADLSNLQFAVQALADAGLPDDHVVWTRVRTYLDRVQNRSETNRTRVEAEIDGEQAVVVAGDDGGAGYGPGMSKAGFVKRTDGTFEARSYGSMTYALLKCLLLSGVDAKDPRVLAALGWLARNFTVDRNPGFESAAEPNESGQQGWYYYVYTLARTLGEYEAATKKPLQVQDADGNPHNWRAELARAILDRVDDDGWWSNPVDRWEEASRVLCTSYAMVALAEAAGRFR